jgi:superfamily II DNA or RNA helicase
MNLRPYQEEAYHCTLEKFETVDTALCVFATGLGKTVYAAHLINHFRKTGRIMMLAHRAELIYQAGNHIKNICDVQSDIEMGSEWATDFDTFKADVVVSTVQTQIAGRDGGRMTRFNPQEFSLLIIDEAHHAPAITYKRIIEYYKQNPELKILGLTATPDRTDKKAMGQIFDEVAYSYDIRDGIDEGWLVPIEQQSVFVNNLDYSSVKTTAGDLNGKDLANVLEFEEILHGIADPTVQLTGERKTLIFAASVAHAERLTEIINRHKSGKARFVCGTTPKEIRRDMFKEFAEKKFQYLVNVGVATEGFDDPGIECVVMARPTKSRTLYAQMAGRGTRPLPGIVDLYDSVVERREAIADSEKPHLEIMDFVGNAGRHKLVTSADILGGNYSYEVVELAKKNAERDSAEKKKPVDIATELQKAEREIAKRFREAEEAIARDHLLLRAKYSTAKINPFNVLDIDPKREAPWHKDRPPSQKQRAYLEKMGVNTDGLRFTHASQIIDNLIKRRENEVCTYKMAKCLQKQGYDTTEMPFKKAGMLIGALVKAKWQKWQLPKHLKPEAINAGVTNAD